MLQFATRQRLKPFKTVTKHVGVKHQVRRLAETLGFVEAQNPRVDVNYFTISISRRLSDDEKSACFSEIIDTISAIEDMLARSGKRLETFTFPSLPSPIGGRKVLTSWPCGNRHSRTVLLMYCGRQKG
jgi:hypothetical protein